MSDTTALADRLEQRGRRASHSSKEQWQLNFVADMRNASSQLRNLEAQNAELFIEVARLREGIQRHRDGVTRGGDTSIDHELWELLDGAP